MFCTMTNAVHDVMAMSTKRRTEIDGSIAQATLSPHQPTASSRAAARH
jgi:hypothetical protein